MGIFFLFTHLLSYSQDININMKNKAKNFDNNGYIFANNKKSRKTILLDNTQFDI